MKIWIKKNIWLLLLIFLASVIFGYSLTRVVDILWDWHCADSVVSELQDSKNGKEAYIATLDEIITDVSAYEKYKDIYAINNDMVGWVRIPETNIDYPVVQSVYEPEYYLYRDFYGNSNSSGTPFAQANCAVGLCGNTIIYGHNMSNNTVFSQLTNYTNKEYADKHPYIFFDTVTEYGVYEVCAAFSIDATSNEFPFWEYLCSSDEELMEYAKLCNQNSYYNTGVNITKGDKLISLVTCEYTHEQGRFILVAKKIA
ncbi:MAG: class B sortase [Bacteroidales bacterium]|nr:class B sortase [Bacteroidales bacterium]